jgi:putative ABC transport system ATP-binding protein
MTAVESRLGHAPNNSPAAVCELRGVSKSYFKPDGAVLVEALKSINLAIPRGQFVAVMGPSGSGKSTLMNILGCLDRPTKGDYLLDGKNVATMTDEEASLYRGRKIGFIFQAFNLISQLRVEDNVEVPLFYQAVPKQERAARSREALALVGLQDRIGHRPRELSGGQQQRAAIARALVGRPVVLMADEPTGNLDSATGQAILKVFDDLHEKGMTIIVVTHDDSIARRCQRVVRFRDGVIESDTHN